MQRGVVRGRIDAEERSFPGPAGAAVVRCAIEVPVVRLFQIADRGVALDRMDRNELVREAEFEDLQRVAQRAPQRPVVSERQSLRRDALRRVNSCTIVNTPAASIWKMTP